MATIRAYQGICPPSRKHPKGNLGTLWIKGEDGLYRSIGRNFSLTEEAIQSDAGYGFLMPTTIEIKDDKGE